MKFPGGNGAKSTRRSPSSIAGRVNKAYRSSQHHHRRRTWYPLVDNNSSLRRGVGWLASRNQMELERECARREDGRMNGPRYAERRRRRSRDTRGRALRCGWVTAWLLANPHTSYRDIIILYSHPTHSTSHARDPPRAAVLLHYALQIVSSVALRGAIIATTQRLC